MEQPRDCLAFRGTLLHAPGELGSVQVLTEHLVIVNIKGVIIHLAPAGDDDAAVLQGHGIDPAAVRVLGPQQFLLPGFIDTHAHAPQYQYCGVGTDLPLIGDSGWLATYAFPTEASFADLEHARSVYDKCVGRLLRLGTTTANYFTTIHAGACKVLADVALQAGQRAVLGKVCMDQNSPDFYTEATAAESLQGAADVIRYIQGLNCSRLLPAVIPRFIPTCSQQLLAGLGKLAAEQGLRIHSHISESLDQVQFTQQLHPSSSSSSSDADVYNQAGLLTQKSIFAHGTQLTQQEMQLMAARGAAVAHCPLSNFYFGDGLFDVAKALSMGLKVGLGTDVAGGYSPSMLQAQRMAVVSSHALKAAALMYGNWREQEQQQQQQQRQRQAGEQEEQQQQQQQEQSKGQELQEPGHQRSSGSSMSLQQTEGSTAGSKQAASAITNPAVAAAAAAHMLTWEDALWLATAGGAAALGLQENVGYFAVGMEFDALLIDVAAPGSPFDVWAGQVQPLVMLEQFLNNGDDRNIAEVYVQGRRCL